MAFGEDYTVDDEAPRWCMWCGNRLNRGTMFGSYCETNDCPVFGLLQMINYKARPSRSELKANPMLQKPETK